MNKLETFIRPECWEKTYAALAELGLFGTLRQVKTFGRIAPRREVFRGSGYVLETNNELELSLNVPDQLLDSVLDALAQDTGDAEIIVSSVDVVGRSRRRIAPAQWRRTSLQRG